MFWKTSFFAVILGFGISSCSTPTTEEQEVASIIGNPYSDHSVVIDLEEIELDQPLLFVDLRKSEEYVKGHIAGAVNLHRSEFQRRDLPYGGMALSSDSMALLLSAKGVNSDDFLILYDDKGGVEASRLWWILRMYGHEKVRILNGGIHVWLDKLELGSALRNATHYEFKDSPMTDTYISYVDFENWRSRTGVKVLDCRSAAEFNGEYIKEGAFLAGHVDGARNICYSNTITSKEDKMKLKSPAELKAIYSEFFHPEDTILVYCQSGVRSAHTLMVLKEILGYPYVYNYDGSWIEWSYRNKESVKS
jgi:thiosulfate/3-mercaptopyruvate sulfurtransferase